MVSDVVGILDGYGIASAHVVGVSFGAGIAQVMAIDHPDRVRTLTSIMFGPPEASLPPPPNPGTLDAVVAAVGAGTSGERLERFVDLWRSYAGPAFPFDEAAARARECRIVERARDLASAWNHSQVITQSRSEELASVRAPTLVIHGTDDPVIPFSHGDLAARSVPGPTFLAVEGMGHYLGPPVPALLTEAIMEHTA
jgi:pimeloyl-ACP methyl ester carboxylesterase